MLVWFLFRYRDGGMREATATFVYSSERCMYHTTISFQRSALVVIGM